MSSAMPSPAVPELNVGGTLGALLVGGLITYSLYGMTCTQTYVYYQRQRSQHDRISLRLLVLALWFLDTFDTIINGHLLYHYLVTNYLNPIALAFPVWSIILHVAVTSITDFVVRLMYARRILKLSKSYALSGVVVAVTLLDLVCGLIITVKAFRVGTWSQLHSISSLFYINFAAGTAGDAYVAAVLSYFLHQSRTGFQRTDSLINVLTMYTINTGLLTAIDAAAGMITYIVMPNNFVFIAFYLNLSKLYVNSYLASLNAREGLRERSFNTGLVSIQLSKFSNNTGSSGNDVEAPSQSQSGQDSGVEVKRSRSVGRIQSPEPLSIHVETTVDRTVEFQRVYRTDGKHPYSAKPQPWA
ncbi:hypothetical protein JAAARDRAFT_38900 [Jaapia argillacea MUCL 33604]|uniref:DUF6534 domain-containing protein n=1 Tax=Jaapia argillacea MUCL 33604 TaxID=933084 RepID=A0A067PGN8_9AGAM|nr:hypothetical protein JAAARDRAFT_38900 [Jaapia argillacea MUCL 33604]